MAYITVNKSNSAFNGVTYTGAGGSQAITGVGFQPDFVWAKQRNETRNHALFDVVRGVQKQISTSQTDAESTASSFLTAFGTDGFTMGGSDNVNKNGGTYISWNWKMGGSASTNNNGTISAQVSANTTAGMSIATWTGTGSNGSVGHGLSGVDCMIIKDLSNSRDIYFWNKGMAYNDRLELTNQEAVTHNTDNMTALPDSTKINMATSTQNNGSGNNYVGYFFKEVKGFSAFGKATGNGSNDGTFIYTGMKPKFFMTKNDNGEAWNLSDIFRVNAPNNPRGYFLHPNKTNTEATGLTYNEMDFVSNGVKYRNSHGQFNGSGVDFYYMAFGQSLVGSNNIPCTAR